MKGSIRFKDCPCLAWPETKRLTLYIEGTKEEAPTKQCGRRRGGAAGIANHMLFILFNCGKYRQIVSLKRAGSLTWLKAATAGSSLSLFFCCQLRCCPCCLSLTFTHTHTHTSPVSAFRFSFPLSMCSRSRWPRQFASSRIGRNGWQWD